MHVSRAFRRRLFRSFYKTPNLYILRISCIFGRVMCIHYYASETATKPFGYYSLLSLSMGTSQPDLIRRPKPLHDVSFFRRFSPEPVTRCVFFGRFPPKTSGVRRVSPCPACSRSVGETGRPPVIGFRINFSSLPPPRFSRSPVKRTFTRPDIFRHHRKRFVHFYRPIGR